jgi:hypothetical protein
MDSYVYIYVRIDLYENFQYIRIRWVYWKSYRNMS